MVGKIKMRRKQGVTIIREEWAQIKAWWFENERSEKQAWRERGT